MTKLKILLISTPVGPLGSGIGGGVELTIKNLTIEMKKRGHQITVVAPENSVLSTASLVEIPGHYQTMAQLETEKDKIPLVYNSVLANMWDYVRTVQKYYDVIINCAYDWLPFYLTPFFETPIAHFVSMSSMNPQLDQTIDKVAQNFPGTIGVCTKIQADTFPFAEACYVLGGGFDLSLYQFSPDPKYCLAWVGRIAPEKALEDAVAVAEITGIPLKIFGKMQDEFYWKQICQNYPNAPIEYQGFLNTLELQQQLGQCRALLMTPRWTEAFGNVVIEALACGVPVISYARGGPAEMIKDGITGFLVEPDNIAALVSCVERIEEIDRAQCRQQAENEYSLKAWGDRVEQWLFKIKK